MTESSFDKEDILQELLASYPDLLPGDQIDPENPRQWILIARELDIPGDSEEAGRFNLDHLFLDQDGIPTLVECKRSSDTRLRREVVAQMLDYAANGTKYLTMDRIRQAAAETRRQSNRTLDDEIKELIEAKGEDEIEDFWKSVEDNLKKGKVRLLFVSDLIPKELRRLVEFLNEQMIETEVLAVEVKQFIGEKQKALVPRVIGATETARSVKSTGGIKIRTNQDEFMSKCTPEAAGFFHDVLEEATKRGQTVRWGVTGFSVGVSVAPDGRRAPIIFCYPENRVEIWPGYLEYLLATPQEINETKKEFLKYGVFHESQKALLVRISPKNIDRVREAYSFWLSKISSIMNTKGK
jgi:hypothetical protein